MAQRIVSLRLLSKRLPITGSPEPAAIGETIMANPVADQALRRKVQDNGFEQRARIRSYGKAACNTGLNGASGPSPAPHNARMVPSWPENFWCGRRELNPHGLAACGFSYRFGFRRPADGGLAVWTIPSPFLVRGLGAARLVSTPSRIASELGSGLPLQVSRLSAVLHRRFPEGHSIA